MESVSERADKVAAQLTLLLWRIHERAAEGALLLLGIGLLHFGPPELSLAQCAGPVGSCSDADFHPDLIQNAVGNLFLLIEGAFGALVMVVAGIGAILASAMGAYRAALGMLIVAIGAFILRSLVSLFFGAEFVSYEAT